MWSHLASFLVIAFIIRRIILFKQRTRSVGNLAGYRTLFNANTIFGNFLPKIRGINQGRNYPFKDKHSVYAWTGCNVTAHVSVFPDRSNIIVADATAIKEITTHRARFPKPIEYYQTMAFFGPNVIASEGDDWKKYRKITQPTFSEKNNRLVWDATIDTVNQFLDQAWGDKDQIVLNHCLDIINPITLSVIAAAGFGRSMTWKSTHAVSLNHRLTFKESLKIVASYLLPRVVLPDWVMPLTQKTRDIDLGFKELRSYMIEFIEERKHSDKVERHDLFSNLLAANLHEDEKNVLDAHELIGNIFVFFVAGHESSAHTLCYALGLLALHQEEQEKLYQHIKSIVKDPRAPVYSDLPLLTRPLAVLYEALRLYPVVPIIPKRCDEDTTISVKNSRDETVVIPIPKGTYVNIDVCGLHYNPKYWKDPSSFNPERFMTPGWNKDAFVPFSAGARACLGRRFSEVESVAILVMILSRYKVTPREEPQFAHETFEQKRDRILKSTNLVTLTPVKVPLVFTRRS